MDLTNTGLNDNRPAKASAANISDGVDAIAHARPSIAEDGLSGYDRAGVTAATRLLPGQ
jgi:hypothetical protein